MFKLTDKYGGVHYIDPEEKKTLGRIAQSIKLGAQYDEWLTVYEDVLLRHKAVMRMSEIYLIQEIGGTK